MTIQERPNIKNFTSKEKYEEYLENNITCKYDEIIDVCIEWINKSEKDRTKMINKSYKWFIKNYNMDEYFPLNVFKQIISKSY